MQAGAPRRTARRVTMHEDCGAATALVGLSHGACARRGPIYIARQPAHGSALAASAGRDGRVAEGARLESVYTGNRIVGSNPTPSAKPHDFFSIIAETSSTSAATAPCGTSQVLVIGGKKLTLGAPSAIEMRLGLVHRHPAADVSIPDTNGGLRGPGRWRVPTRRGRRRSRESGA